MIVLALPVGVLIGLSLGAMGAGGSILTVPALVYLLGQSPHQATTTSLILVGASALAGVLVHARSGRVRVVPGIAFGVLGAAGSVLGTHASTAVSSAILLLGFAALLIVAAVALLHRSTRVQRSTDRRAPAATVRTDVRQAVKIFVAASLVGLLTGFFGVGGGFVVVPALVLVLGYDTAAAVGTSLVVITINSAVSLATRLTTQSATLDWPLLGLFLAASIAGVVLGNRLAARANQRRLTTAFAVLLLVIGIFTGTQSVTQLA